MVVFIDGNDDSTEDQLRDVSETVEEERYKDYSSGVGRKCR